jgi:glycerol-3-phosphate O-acyltransferase / dihydroxyacetone phosphate acyltransferase
MFAKPNDCPSFLDLKFMLLKYHALLQASKLTNRSLSHLPIPKTLDIKGPAPLPSRLSTIGPLLTSVLSCAIRLPFFVIPLLLHTPVYYVANFGAKGVQEEEESIAQAKMFFGLFGAILTYSVS